MKKIIIILIFSLFTFLLTNSSSAQLLDGRSGEAMKNNADQIQISGGLGSASIGLIAATAIQAALGLLAIIFLALIVFSGFQWMTAAGNDTQIKKAQDTIKTAVIGLIIVLAAYAITYFIFTYLPFSSGTVGGDNNNLGGSH